MEAIIVLFFLVIFICFSLLKERLEIKRLKKEGAAIDDQIKKLREKREEEIRQAKLNPFNREEAEKAAKEYHKQKGQFLEIVDEKTKRKFQKQKENEKKKKISEKKKEIRALKKAYKEAKDYEVSEPLRIKIQIAEAELTNIKYGTPPPQPDDSNFGKKGGRYYLRVSKNGNYYRQYY